MPIFVLISILEALIFFGMVLKIIITEIPAVCVKSYLVWLEEFKISSQNVGLFLA